MARPKKEGKFVNFYMDAGVYAGLVKFSEETGLTKTMTMERALKQYIELSNGYSIKDDKPVPSIPFDEYITKR